MDIIINNPYRILGLPIFASERDISKRVSDFDVYISIEKEPKKLKSDLSWIGPLIRNKETISNSLQKIENIHSKILFSMFNFLELDEIDKKAIENLRLENLDEAKELWLSYSNVNYINSTNFQSTKNLSFLYLVSSFCTNSNYNLDEIINSLQLTNYLFESNNFWKSYLSVIPNASIVGREIIENIINEYYENVIVCLEEYSQKTDSFSLKDLASNIKDNSVSDIFNQKLMERLTQNKLNKLEKIIEKYKEVVDNSKDDSYLLAENLISEIKSDILYLKDIFVNNELKFEIIKEKIAKFLLKCVNLSFNNKFPDKGNVIIKSKNILNYALKLKCSENINNEINVSISVLNKIKDNLMCWFCGKNMNSEKHLLNVDMHKVISREQLFNRTTTHYQTLKVKVSRCKKCHDFHKKISDLKITIFLVSTISGLLIGALLEEHWIAGSIIGAIIGILAGYQYADIKSNKEDIRLPNNSTLSVNKNILELTREGWKFGRSPS